MRRIALAAVVAGASFAAATLVVGSSPETMDASLQHEPDGLIQRVEALERATHIIDSGSVWIPELHPGSELDPSEWGDEWRYTPETEWPGGGDQDKFYAFWVETKIVADTRLRVHLGMTGFYSGGTTSGMQWKFERYEALHQWVPEGDANQYRLWVGVRASAESGRSSIAIGQVKLSFLVLGPSYNHVE